MWGKDKDENQQPEDDGTPALADRVGTYTPSLEDRRRIAVSNIIMFAQNNGGMLMPQDFAAGITRNIADLTEIMPLTEMVKIRIMKIAQGGEF